MSGGDVDCAFRQMTGGDVPLAIVLAFGNAVG